MSIDWVIKAFERQHLVKKELLRDMHDPYPQDNKLFVCDCCNTVWQYACKGQLDIYKDFPTIGKKTKRMPGHENSKNNL